MSKTKSRWSQLEEPASATLATVATSDESSAAASTPKLPFPQRITPWLTVITAGLVILTPVFYFNGRSFHDGWYLYFNLDASMFPLNPADMLSMGGRAWTDGLSEISLVILHHFPKLWHKLAWLILGDSLAVVAMRMFINYVERRNTKRDAKLGRQKKEGDPHWIKQFILTVVLIGFFFVFLFVGLILLTMGFAGLSYPFRNLGSYEAQLEVQSDFKDVPLLSVKTATGDQFNLPEIGCGPQFCAVWDNGHALTVPVAAVTWGVSAPPTWTASPTPPKKQ
jgi:hypothetical protein